MNTPKLPIFTNVLQVAVVVDDLYKAMKHYYEIYGIGPWKVYTFNSSTVSDMVIRDKSSNYSMKLSLCNIGNVQWELIQPLDEKSIYYEFLKEHGPGLHHVAFAVNDYDETVNYFRQNGIGVLQGGLWNNLQYTYLDTQSTMSAIAEIYQISKDFTWPEPEEVYPSK
ncbi:MAG: VOC family protein [Desulfurella sp.]|uniref:VOC family protein n=1 Tax=Desulfurella sp. TaxID=1962857 RepID=UPI003C82212C